LDGAIRGTGRSYRDDVRQRPCLLLRHVARFSGAVLVARKMAALDGQIVLDRGQIPDQLRGIREG
jgi:hypothetical protein